MAKVGIFFGSSTGATREAAEVLADEIKGAELIDMEEDFDGIDQFEDYDVLLIGSSTWGQGDPQRDWVDPLYELSNDQPDLSGKKVAFFGAGDQKTHGEHFVSALGKMHDLFVSLGASAYGYTPTEGFDYEYSLAEKEGKFCGLAFDNVNQEDLTEERVTQWAGQLKSEMGL
ncbi:MAG: flavodoxin [Sulfuricurvum sp. MLSB]|uniref:flavodoxin n=1 Tax=unclassified Sulfuricurvum TaxID=2632390 RepID=UPI0005004870|nr:MULTISPECIES: flavodoxin [unclassified Sulfuricurvum]KFN40714.1 MAG: flavodoxin [Sulfuricurvum sp. MLSB]